MKIAVTGGTGFVGRHLVKRLLQDKHDITVMTHRQTGEQLFDNRVRLVTGSVHKPAQMAAAFEGSEVLYHLVGIIAETRTNTFEKTVSQGSGNVVAACRVAGVRKIVYLSGLGTSAEAVSKYHRTKYAAEQAIIDSGLDWVIFRSSVIYGKGDGFISLLSKVIRLSPVVPVFGDGRYKLQPVHVDDLVEVMTRALTTQGAAQKIIDVGGPEQLEYIRILEVIKRALGKKRMNIFVPISVIKPVAAFLELILKPAPLTRDQLEMMQAGNIGDISSMRELFEIEPVIFEMGVKDMFGVTKNG